MTSTTYNGRSNYATRAVALRCETVSDVDYIQELIEDKQDELSKDWSVFGDLFCIQAIDYDEIRDYKKEDTND